MELRPACWLRWAFNIRLWIPKASEWTLAYQCLDDEEQERIDRFVFQDAAKSALIGRLMLQSSIHVAAGLKYADIRFTRTTRGRPYAEGVGVDVNISHHGDWVVLALEGDSRVGIDVMSFSRPVNIPLPEYFRLMRSQLTVSEWDQVESSINPLHTFYRFWCLKESYIKAIGIGLGFDLQTIDFRLNEPLLANRMVKSTTMLLNGSHQSDWVFEETLLGSDHCVAVCTGKTSSITAMTRDFQVLSTESLFRSDAILHEANSSWWERFSKKLPAAKIDPASQANLL